jgi:hypothetical protein
MLEAIMQTMEPPLEGLSLCPGHRYDEPGLRDRPTDLDAWRPIESRLDVNG